jgi:hypothetical protein
MQSLQLSPVSINELNHTSQQPTVTPATSAVVFTPVNSAAFTAVNTGSMGRESSCDGLRLSSRESQHASLPHCDARAYTGAYDTSPSNPAPRPISDVMFVPPVVEPVGGPPIAPSCQTVNSSTKRNSHRGSPASHGTHLALIALHPQQQSYSRCPTPNHKLEYMRINKRKH